MAKKKNRQKEFKRKQKLMIKVVSEEEIALTESLGYQPVFVERRKIQNFDEQNIAMMQYFYEYGVYPDVQEINSKLGTGTFDWNQDHALFREAMYTPNKQKRNKLLKQVLKEYWNLKKKKKKNGKSMGITIGTPLKHARS